MNIQLVASSSAQGRGYAARIQELQRKKNDELAAKQKELQAAQQKLQQGQPVMSDTARAALKKDIDRMTREYPFLTQDAQAEVQDLQTELQAEFQKQLEPVIKKVAVAKSLYMVFSVGDSGLVSADRRLDIASEVIKEFDSAVPPRRREAGSPRRAPGFGAGRPARPAAPPPARPRAGARFPEPVDCPHSWTVAAIPTRL